MKIRPSLLRPGILCLLPALFFLAACGRSDNNVPTDAEVIRMMVGGAALPPASELPASYPRDPESGKPLPIGNLGGVPAVLPHYVEFLEYDDSPGFDAEKIRNFHAPVRTFDSTIMSFGFQMRYPDMRFKGRNAADNSKYWHESSEPGNPWVDVTVLSGSRYPTVRPISNVLNRRVARKIAPPRIRLPDKQFGLEVYPFPSEYEEARRAGKISTVEQDDIFITRDKNGNVNRYIRCFIGNVPRPPCEHNVILENGMKVDVSLAYNRDQLPHWREIEIKALHTIYSFAVDGQANPQAVQASPPK